MRATNKSPKYPTKPTIADRALRAENAIRLYKFTAGTANDPLVEEDIADLIADLMHFCADHPEISFNAARDSAHRHFCAERFPSPTPLQ